MHHDAKMQSPYHLSQGLSSVPFVTPTGATGGAEGSGGNGSYRVHPPCGDSSAARAARGACPERSRRGRHDTACLTLLKPCHLSTPQVVILTL
jgi:hypothetical protein